MKKKNIIKGKITSGNFTGKNFVVNIGPTGYECDISVGGKRIDLVQKLTITMEPEELTLLTIEAYDLPGKK